MVEAPIYHLPFITSDVEARKARAARYEALRPGLVSPTGLPTNAMELPEMLSPPITAPVPEQHRRSIEAVLSASGTARGPADAVPVSLAEMDPLWSCRVAPESAYRATIRLIGAPVPFSPGERRPIYFEVRNEGTETWGWDHSMGPYVHVVHRLLHENRLPVDDWQPSFFTEWVRPGMATVVPAMLEAPADPGRYLLEVKVRHAPAEGRLFGSADDAELSVRPGGAWGERPELSP
jgi:hypothetical protein